MALPTNETLMAMLNRTKDCLWASGPSFPSYTNRFQSVLADCEHLSEAMKLKPSPELQERIAAMRWRMDCELRNPKRAVTNTTLEHEATPTMSLDDMAISYAETLTGCRFHINPHVPSTDKDGTPVCFVIDPEKMGMTGRKRIAVSSRDRAIETAWKIINGNESRSHDEQGLEAVPEGAASSRLEARKGP